VRSRGEDTTNPTWLSAGVCSCALPHGPALGCQISARFVRATRRAERDTNPCQTRATRRQLEAPKARRFHSPGQRPGNAARKTHRALKGRNPGTTLARAAPVPPNSAPSGRNELCEPGSPGRCPGLMNSRPVGAERWPAMGAKPLRSSMCLLERSSHRVAGNCRLLPCHRQGCSPRAWAAHGSRVRIKALKAHRFVSPGQRPGNSGPPNPPRPEGAQLRDPNRDGRAGDRAESYPFRAGGIAASGHPGRCPGLENLRPVGADTRRPEGAKPFRLLGSFVGMNPRGLVWRLFAGNLAAEEAPRGRKSAVWRKSGFGGRTRSALLRASSAWESRDEKAFSRDPCTRCSKTEIRAKRPCGPCPVRFVHGANAVLPGPPPVTGSLGGFGGSTFPVAGSCAPLPA